MSDVDNEGIEDVEDRVLVEETMPSDTVSGASLFRTAKPNTKAWQAADVLFFPGS